MPCTKVSNRNYKNSLLLGRCYLHYPRQGRHETRGQQGSISDQFLSTPSSQRATAAYLQALCQGHNFYPRPLRRGRQTQPSKRIKIREISIHALFAEGDPGWLEDVLVRYEFLSTPSSQRATLIYTSRKINIVISIHALFAEGDRGTFSV